MLTLHSAYGSANGYPSGNGETNGGNYLDYTTLTNMTADRMVDSKSPLANLHSTNGNGTSPSGTTNGYGYYENAGAGPSTTNNTNSTANYYHAKASNSTGYEYGIQGNNQSDSYSPAANNGNEQLPSMMSIHAHHHNQHHHHQQQQHHHQQQHQHHSHQQHQHHHQMTVTIGPGTTHQRTLPVIYDAIQTPKGSSVVVVVVVIYIRFGYVYIPI